MFGRRHMKDISIWWNISSPFQTRKQFDTLYLVLILHYLHWIKRRSKRIVCCCCIPSLIVKWGQSFTTKKAIKTISIFHLKLIRQNKPHKHPVVMDFIQELLFNRSTLIHDIDTFIIRISHGKTTKKSLNWFLFSSTCENILHLYNQLDCL